MKMDKTVSDLLAVLKDVNRDKVIIALNKINENGYNGNISHVFLKEHFRSDTKVFSKVYYEEAFSIVKIFPQYSTKYIKSLLEALRDEDNRIIIILRLLLKNESKGDKMKILPQRFGAISQVAASSSDDEIEHGDTLRKKSTTKLSIATSKSTSATENSFRDKSGSSRETASQQNLPASDEEPPKKKPKLIRPGAVNSCRTESENVGIQEEVVTSQKASNFSTISPDKINTNHERNEYSAVPQKSSTAMVNDARSVTKNPAPADNRNQTDEASPLYGFELFRKMIEVFRDASLEYIKQLREDRNTSESNIDFVVNRLLSTSYPRLEECLTTYLSAQIKQYTTEFNVRNFLNLIPDPETYFNDPNKPSSVLVNGKVDKPSLHYAISFLGNKYPLVRISVIEHILRKHKYCLIPTVKELDKTQDLMKIKREPDSLDTISVHNIPLVREIAYLTYKNKILDLRDDLKREEEQTDNLS